jgi:hypothetical protein
VILQADALTDTWPVMFNKTLPYTKVSNTHLCCSWLYHDNKNKHPNFHNFTRKMSSFSLRITIHQCSNAVSQRYMVRLVNQEAERPLLCW